MLRKARIDAAGAIHHIIIRGIERKKIFRNDANRCNFVERLGKIVTSRGKAPQTVKVRSLLCYWANRELGMTTVELSKRLRICQSAANRASQIRYYLKALKLHRPIR